MEKAEKLKDLLEYIIGELVATKEDVKVDYEKAADQHVFRVSVAKGEMGRIIGKSGATAHSIRMIMRAAAVKDKLEVRVEFLD